MKEAIKQAYLAAKNNEVPIGAVIIQEHKIIAQAYNLVETNKNPLAHAEILAIEQACLILRRSRLVDCDLYVTLEPCTMCSAAISQARLRRVYFGAYDPKGGGIDHGVKFFNQMTCFHNPEVYGGINEQECQNILRTFFIKKRQIND